MQTSERRVVTMDLTARDPLTGRLVGEIRFAGRYRFLTPGEALHRCDLLWIGAEPWPSIRAEWVGRRVPGHRLFLRFARPEGDVHRFLDEGEVVQGGDQWHDRARGWRPCWDSIGERVVNSKHLRRRADDLVEHAADIRPSAWGDASARQRSITLELGVIGAER